MLIMAIPDVKILGVGSVRAQGQCWGLKVVP